MAFERVEINGREYFKEVKVHEPDVQICPVGCISGEGIPEEDAEDENNLWVKWRRD